MLKKTNNNLVIYTGNISHKQHVWWNWCSGCKFGYKCARYLKHGLECMFYNKCGRTACCLWYGCSDCDCSFAHVLYCSSEAPFVTIVLSFMYARLFMCSMLNHHLLWLWCSDYTFDRAATALWNSVRLIARYKAPVCTGSIRSVVQDFLYYWYFSLVAFAVQNIQLCTFAWVVFCTGNLSQISI